MPTSAQGSRILDNPGVWHNLTTWTAQQWRNTVNVSKLGPSFEELVWAGPRMVWRLGSFISLPHAVDNSGQRIIPEATSTDLFLASSTTIVAADAMSDAINDASLAQASQAAQNSSAFASAFSVEGAKGLGSVFSYATSKWALCCIAMAIILNRAHIFATTRRRLFLPWNMRLALRCIPLLLFVLQARRILQSIQCQTSPDFAVLRWGDANKSSDLLFSQPRPALHDMSSLLLFNPPDEIACRAVKMIPPESNDQWYELRGSLTILWPLFATFCLGQFLETISSSVQGRPLTAETGMTLFEHSLAFAEADAAIASQLSWDVFSDPQARQRDATNPDPGPVITRSKILERVNTSPEVLLVAFLSTMSHITSHILGVFNMQSRFRLLSTGFWGLCFMGSILWSAVTFSLEDTSKQGLLRFPTVCIIGFIPHVLVLAGILVCIFIYGLALLLSAMSPPNSSSSNSNLSLRQRFEDAQHNMQANVSLSGFRVTREMDFYTALLRTGFSVITLASEAVYLNEDRGVIVKPYTWLDEERLHEMERLQRPKIGAYATDPRYDHLGTMGQIPIEQDYHVPGANGYKQERAAQRLSKRRAGGYRRGSDGVGAAERSNRWLVALDFMMNISRVLFRAWAITFMKVFKWLGFRSVPNWMVWLSRMSKRNASNDERPRMPQPQLGVLALEMVNGINLPRSDEIDVEEEVRNRLAGQELGDDGEASLDAHLYDLWLNGGPWGHVDHSGDYEPELEDDSDNDDVDGIIFDVDGPENDPEDSQDRRLLSPRLDAESREPSPLMDNPMELLDLARLLQPLSPEEREEAHTLSAHFSSQRIMTRSMYTRAQQFKRARILAAGMPGTLGERLTRRSAKLTGEEEAQLLEEIILSRRTPRPHSDPNTGTEDLSNLNSDRSEGILCVVCQCAPRTIIVWPCRCLSLCDDCRVSLAMNNFEKCVCCRREVCSFSKVYVP